MPSRSNDADVKIATSLELAEIVRRRPTSVQAIRRSSPSSKTPSDRRNLAGDLVVDAVPVSNRVYLEAVLGKDTTAKRDDSVKRTSGEKVGFGSALVLRNLRPRQRRFCRRRTVRQASKRPPKHFIESRICKSAESTSAAGSATSGHPRKATDAR